MRKRIWIGKTVVTDDCFFTLDFFESIVQAKADEEMRKEIVSQDLEWKWKLKILAVSQKSYQSMQIMKEFISSRPICIDDFWLV